MFLYTSQSQRHAKLPFGNALVVVVIGLWLCGTTSSIAQQPKNDPYRVNQKPEAAQGIEVEEKLGDFVPMDAMFLSAAAQPVELGALIRGDMPVMLSFNYSDCPKLCSVQLENMTQALKQIRDTYQVGRDLKVISISIDPNEQSSRSRQNTDKYVGMYGEEDSEEHWHFLTGKRANIQAVAKSCGFKYRYIARQKLYSHPPVFIMLSPDGKIVQYVYGLKYEPEVMKNAIAAANQGNVSKAINPESYFGLGCFVFDESTGKYTLQAMAAMRIGGAATVVIMLVTLIPYWLSKGRSKDEPREFVIGANKSTT